MSESELILIMGPMFSGKTTKLIELYNEISKSETCLTINYALDNRYGEGKIVTHDGLSIDGLCITDLNEIFIEEKHQKFLRAKYIFINEAQFFKDLKLWVDFVMKCMKKNVVLCGLDLDFKKQQFGELLDLVVNASTVHMLTGRCNTQNCPNPSLYSHRIVKNAELILIGSSEYVPLCEQCYKENNK